MEWKWYEKAEKAKISFQGHFYKYARSVDLPGQIDFTSESFGDITHIFCFLYSCLFSLLNTPSPKMNATTYWEFPSISEGSLVIIIHCSIVWYQFQKSLVSITIFLVSNHFFKNFLRHNALLFWYIRRDIEYFINKSSNNLIIFHDSPRL